MEKSKMVHLEPKVHQKIKHIATDKNTSIQSEVNEILKEKLDMKNGE